MSEYEERFNRVIGSYQVVRNRERDRFIDEDGAEFHNFRSIFLYHALDGVVDNALYGLFGIMESTGVLTILDAIFNKDRERKKSVGIKNRQEVRTIQRVNPKRESFLASFLLGIRDYMPEFAR